MSKDDIIDNFVHKISLHYLGVHPDEFRGYYPQEIVSTIEDIAKTMKNERKKLDWKIPESEEVFYKESDIIKIVDEHMNESGILDDDISCILKEIPSCKQVKQRKEEELLDYLFSTGLYSDKDGDMYYEKEMLYTAKTIPIKELVIRLIDLDREYNGSPWNIAQILANVHKIIPMEDR